MPEPDESSGTDSPGEERHRPPGMSRGKRLGYLIVAGLILLVTLVLPGPEGLSVDAKHMLGILVLAAFLWVTEALPVAVTGILVIVLQPLLGIMEAQEVFLSFGNKAVFFLIGAFMIAAGMEKHNLHKRIALKFLVHFESSPRLMTLGVLLISAFMSFIVPEHAVAALMLPIGISILLALRVVPRESNFGKVIMISIAYGCSIGSLGTMIGGARNPLTIAFLDTVDIQMSFVEWMLYSMPVVLVSLPLVWLVLVKTFPVEIKSLGKAKVVLEKEVGELGAPKTGEKTTMFVLAFTVVLWVLFSDVLGLAVIALLGGIFLFLGDAVEWKDVETRIPWGIVLLYAGAISLGVGMETSGAAQWLVGGLPGIIGENPMVAILLLYLMTIILTEMMSNVAAVAVMLPIAYTFSTAIPGLGPVVAIMTVALSGGLAFMMVIATPGNAIAYSSGYFSPRDLVRSGMRVHIVCITVIFIIAITYWKFIGAW